MRMGMRGLEKTLRGAAAAAYFSVAPPAFAQQAPAAWVATVQAETATPESLNAMSLDTRPGSSEGVYAFRRFCERFPHECKIPDEMPPTLMERIKGTDADIKTLNAVNFMVNNELIPKTDMEMHGEPDVWEIGRVFADCEDYALRKREELEQKHNWPPKDLLMTVVITEKGETHAVLTARTARGDYVLDNLQSDALPWLDLVKKGYQFVMRQSYLNPRVWYAIKNPKL